MIISEERYIFSVMKCAKKKKKGKPTQLLARAQIGMLISILLGLGL
jgi:hypothetical protein